MARLIDADKRIAEIKKLYCDGCDNCCGVKCLACWVDDAMCLIDDAATVDAVEVVRCKDCQKCLIDNSKMELHLCMKRPSFPVRVKLDGFCSDGERNDGDRDG